MTHSIKTALTFFLAAAVCCAQGVISTVAGNGTDGYSGDNGPALSASMHPNGVTVDAVGNIYIADLSKSVIRRVDTNGIITTVAGFAGEKTVFSGDGGPATQASIYISSNHNGLAVDIAGNLYIADDGHGRIRKVDTKGIITTVAGNGKTDFADGVAAISTSLGRPSGVAVDKAGNLFIAETNGARIRKVDTNGIITTVAGNGGFGYTGDGGPAAAATLFSPMDVTLDAAGNIYIADQDANVIRKVDAITGIITTVAGNGNVQGPQGDGGLATNAIIDGPYSVAVDGVGNIYIAEYVAHRVRKVDPLGIMTTAVGAVSTGNLGDGGPPTSAQILPAGLAVDTAGNYYIADEGHNRIRKVTLGARVPGLLASVPSLYFSQTASGNSANAQIVTIYTTGSVPLGFSASASTAPGGADWLKVTSPGTNTPSQLTVFPDSQLAAGTYKGNIILTPTAPDLPTVNIPVTFLVTATPPARPTISSVVNAAGFQNSIAPNTFATIKGTNLASTTDTWDKSISNGQLPTSLDGVTVTFDGKPGYVSYVSSTQINVLVPNIEARTSTAVLVTNTGAKLTSGFNAPAAQYSPAFFPWPNNQAVATHQDYSYAVKNSTFATLPTVAAKPGEVIILWGTGFGATNASYLLGYQTPGDQAYSTSAAATMTIGNIPATVYGVALAPGFAGLYQVAIQVPPSLGSGDWPVAATIGGVQSPTGIVITVQP